MELTRFNEKIATLFTVIILATSTLQAVDTTKNHTTEIIENNEVTNDKLEKLGISPNKVYKGKTDGGTSYFLLLNKGNLYQISTSKTEKITPKQLKETVNSGKMPKNVGNSWGSLFTNKHKINIKNDKIYTNKYYDTINVDGEKIKYLNKTYSLQN